MLGHLLLPEIEDMIRRKDFAGMREALSDLRPPDLGELIAELPPTDEAVIFRILPRNCAGEVFGYLPLETQQSLLRAMADDEVAAILDAMPPDDRTALLEELPSEATKLLMSHLSPEELRKAKLLLGYPEQSIGRLMTPDYVAIQEGWTIEQVLQHIRKVGRDSETLNVLYVVDTHGHLLDDIRVREILLAPPDKKVSDLMNRTFVALKVTDDQETAVAAFKKYDMVALPVTDSNGVLVGIVTIDDVLHIAEQEATEDIQKMGGMEALDEPYMTISFRRMIKKRAGWLVILFLGELFTATAMGFYEKEIARATVLALFIPLIISSGGNSGSQATTLVIRALAVGEVRLRDWWRVIRREVYSGLALGLILGTIGFFRIFIWSRFSNIYDPHPLLVAFTVYGALIGVVLWGTIAGSMLPFVLKKLGADPATSSAPFVATLVDVTGLIIYFSVAALILRGTLL